MNREEEEKKHFAVLIDADNISEKYAGSIFNEIADYGFASYRRIYGNWAKGNGWKEDTLLENAISPIQQFNYTIGKNATDMAMVIDAMDILYSGKVDGFCLVTSDSDFTKLAMRLREEQMYVIGMGESKTPLALTKACNKFIHLDLISGEVEEKAAELLSLLRAEGPRRLTDLIRRSGSRSEATATFLALLELCREGKIHLAGEMDNPEVSWRSGT